jgi:FLVCR family MFS transporter 7
MKGAGAQAVMSPPGGEAAPAFAADPRRFRVLALFCLGNGVNEFMWICFSPIFAATARLFSVSSFAVTWLPASYLLLFLPAALAGLWAKARFGVRNTVLAAAAAQAVGAWLRYAACAAVGDGGGGEGGAGPGLFALLMFGQALAATAQPVFTNLPAALSAEWFPARQRDMATVAAVMANPIGNALGSALPAFFVTASGGGLAPLTLAQAAVATAVAAGIYFLVPAKPASPPSAAAALREDERAAGGGGGGGGGEAGGDEAAGPLLGRAREGGAGGGALVRVLIKQYGTLLADGNFRLLLLGFGIGLGVFNALLSLLGQLLAPCGYDGATAGLAGGALLGAGLLTAALTGVALERTHAYVPLLRAGILTVLLSAAFMLSSLRPAAAPALYASMALLGAAAVPLLPLTLENAAECTFPLPEDASASLLTMAGKYVGAGLTFALQPMLALPAVAACASVATPTAALILAALAVAAAAIGMFKKDYRRQAAEAAFGKGAGGEGGGPGGGGG